jgi:anti-sigma regulatory factor (Ser/Thr protein kinase)
VAYAAGVGVDQPSLDAVALVVSELVSNAAVAARTAEIELRLEARGTVMHVEVADDGPGVPHLVKGSERGGYGLHLLEAVCRAWGYTPLHRGKTTWADIPVGWCDGD